MSSAVTVIGVRHHSPACARLVASTIESLRPAYVLVEGPADMNERIGELLLGHQLPVAVFSYYRDGERAHTSWSPFCDYSPEWAALTTGRRVGAELRFIDLPAWHPAFADRTNRYADAERRYAEVVDRLCRAFGVDDVDALWDHLVEADPDDRLAQRLATYFDLVRGETEAGAADAAREAYMARWVRAAAAHADGRPVVVVCGGFHRPALLGADRCDQWPEVPAPPAGATGGSYLVPYTFRRLDAFAGYQSGMPSPEYYQRVWEHGPTQAATDLLQLVTAGLRQRGYPVSTADLVAAQTMAHGLSRLRGHQQPTRTDLLDALLSTLVGDALTEPAPWTRRGALSPGTHPVVVEMVAALSGDRTGRLHPDTPLPPLVGQASTALATHGLDQPGQIRLDLTHARDLARSRVLHQLRVLDDPGVVRHSGPVSGVDPQLTEEWSVSSPEHRLTNLIEMSAYGPTLLDAATARLGERATDTVGDPDQLVQVLSDAALCGAGELSEQVLSELARSVAAVGELGQLSRVLPMVLALWRHDRLFATAGSTTVGTVVAACVRRSLWLVEGVHGATAPADPARLQTLAATRDALVHAGAALGLDRAAALAVTTRVATDPQAPPDLRGAAFGFGWSMGQQVDPVRALRGAAAPATLGDWLAGLFALAREEVLVVSEQAGVLDVLDSLITAMPEHEFLVALPALRQAFTFFPPRERETIAQRLLTRRGLTGSGRDLLRLPADPTLITRAYELEAHVDAVLSREGLLS